MQNFSPFHAFFNFIVVTLAKTVQLKWDPEKVGAATSVRIVFKKINFHEEFPMKCEREHPSTREGIILGACVSGPYKDCNNQTAYQEMDCSPFGRPKLAEEIMSGMTGEMTSCPIGHVITDFCSSSRKPECAGFHHQIRCTKFLDYAPGNQVYTVPMPAQEQCLLFSGKRHRRDFSAQAGQEFSLQRVWTIAIIYSL